MAKRKRPTALEDTGPGLTETESVHVLRTPAGSAFFRPAVPPRSWGRLSEEGQEVIAGLQQIAAQIHEMQGHLEHHVHEARELGASWDLIGWSIGTTGEAVRQRFGVDDE
jgi:hypothetical protein